MNNDKLQIKKQPREAAREDTLVRKKSAANGFRLILFVLILIRKHHDIDQGPGLSPNEDKLQAVKSHTAGSSRTQQIQKRSLL